MKTISDILLLGDERLYAPSEPIVKEELLEVGRWVQDLHNVMEQVR